MIYALSLLLVLSVAGNIFAVFSFSKKTKKNQSHEVIELLQDLSQYGNAVIKIERISPNDVLLRSSRR